MKNFGESELGRIRLPEVLKYDPYYLRNGQSYTDFKFGRYIHSQVPSEQKFIKILEKSERGRIQGLPKILKYPPYLRNG